MIQSLPAGTILRRHKIQTRKSHDSALHPRAATPPVWFLREQFFPQTLPSIIRTQLPLVLLHFGMLPMIWFLAKLQNCSLSQCSGLRSGSGISCDVETSGAAGVLEEGWSSARRPCCTTASQGRTVTVTLLSSLDHQPRPKPAGEGGLCASFISSPPLLDTRQASAREEL